MNTINLYPSRCPICHIEGNAKELYPSNLNEMAFSPVTFSARRIADGIHYRIVKCNTCGLIRSDPIAEQNVIMQLYSQSRLTYEGEIENLKVTYGRYLARLCYYGVTKDALLEIGCGNGFFLEEALSQGYVKVQGVEPSLICVNKASPHIRQRIICSTLRPGLFNKEEFNVICMFQLLDHILDPNTLLSECRRILRKKGLVLCVTHNIEAVSSRLLKGRSPIIDIEHTHFYSEKTISRIFSLCGFKVMHAGLFYNNYSLDYLIKLLPLPMPLKHRLSCLLKNNLFGRVRFRVPLGNLYLIAQKQE